MDCGCGKESSRPPESQSPAFPRKKNRGFALGKSLVGAAVKRRGSRLGRAPTPLRHRSDLMEFQEQSCAQPAEAAMPGAEPVDGASSKPPSEISSAKGKEESLSSHADGSSSSSSSGGDGANVHSLLSKNKVAIYWHPACQLHDIPDHPEQPQRIEHILAALRQALHTELSFRQASLPPMEIVELYHSKSMVDRFTRLWKETQEAYLKNKKIVYRSIDGDTNVMHTTREAALRAVGSLIDAIDHMYLPKDNKLSVDSAFCCVRPPGHHAETNKACGFCFFNNVAIAARYAQSKYGVGKVAILDFDVHHGNGTEEGFENDASIFYASTHELYNFPGTGKDPSPLVGAMARAERDRRIVDRYLHSGSGSREEFYAKWKEILQEMERFDPQLIIISAGFDAHDDDPLSDIELVDGDYYWVTRQILLSALRLSAQTDRKTKVKVFSALEGGYDLDAIARSAVWHVRALREGFAGVAEDYFASVQESEKQRRRGEEAEAASAYGGDEVAALQAELEGMGLLDRS